MVVKHKWEHRIHPDTGKQYTPKALVLHIGTGTQESDLSWIMNPYSNVSYNWYVNKKGQVIEVVPEQHASWANGHVVRPKWKGIVVENNEIVNPNLYTISVAVENRGNLPNWIQWTAWARLCKEIMNRNNWTLDDMHVVNHFEIKGSKSCPRPYFTRRWLQLLINYV